MKVGKLFFFYWLPVLVFMGIIFLLSSRQRIAVADSYSVNFIVFKSLHLIEYATLYLLLFRALYKSFSSKMKVSYIYGLAVCIAILYAISDEVHQTFTPTRQGSPRDVIIDTIGILVAFSYTKKYLKKLKRFI